MTVQYRLQTPLSPADLAPLKAGDTVLLSGVVYTARDAAHGRMMQLLDEGNSRALRAPPSITWAPPRNVRAAPSGQQVPPLPAGWMPTPPRLLDLGLACMIGKGKRSQAVKDSVVKNGAVYLAAIGGAGALMAGSIESCEIIAWPDLGCEAGAPPGGP